MIFHSILPYRIQLVFYFFEEMNYIIYTNDIADLPKIITNLEAKSSNSEQK